MRRHLAWPIALPLAVLGALAGHEAGYRVAVPDAHERAHLLEQTGHGYLAYMPIAVGAGLALAVLGFAAIVAATVRPARQRRASAPAWLVAVLPPLVFVLQEYLERYTRHGEIEWGTASQPAFLAGLALQLPFALLAALIAAGLGRLAEGVAALIGAGATPRPRVDVPLLGALAPIDVPLAPVLARGYAGRAPPLLR